MKDGNDTRPAVLVTGGSEGIGLEIALCAAREGARVVLIARSADRLAAAAEAVRRAGGEPFVLALDLTQADAGDAVERFLAAERLHVEILVNNAGFGLHGAAAALPRIEQERLVALNIAALTSLTLRFLPGMVTRRAGGIINLGSVAGFVPGPYMALYYASKAFVHSFSEALSAECRKTGVTITCVAPGPVETRFFDRAGAERARLFRTLPRATAAGVAARAWRGFRRRQRMVIPGFWLKLGAIAGRLTPRTLLLPAMMQLQRRRRG